MESKNYLVGPKLGDCINSLMVCNRNYEKHGFKANIYLTDIGCSFEKGLEFTYSELFPILIKQKWFNNLEIYNNQNIDINLILFRNSPYLYRENWLNIFFKTFLGENNPPKDYKWIDIEETDSSLKDTLLINRSIRYLLNDTNAEIYQRIIKKHNNNKFICFDEAQYNNFKFKDQVELLKVDSLYDFFVKINSCKYFLGNQSSPTTIASSLNKPRIIELCDDNDANHYKSDEYFYSNIKCF